MLSQPIPFPWDDSNEPASGLHVMREACRFCGNQFGVITNTNGQAVCHCSDCGKWLYNVPKAELGTIQRTVTTIHNGIKPKQRARILERATGRCELCGSKDHLHVGHLLSVNDGLEMGLTEHEINDDENLSAMCEECNLGLGSITISPRIYVAILRRRLQQ